mmetsp:Transcript_2489/g.7436  ORF Transcript_2489/g.7436 Transcript_2489/m.7436 type:complete len:244 (+) Transcript_2489:181-912(+)
MNLLYFDVGRGQTDEAGCLRVLNKCTNTGGKFLQVAAPVCADLQNSSKLQEKGKTGMTVPSLLHVATLWIRIRVQQKLLLNLPLALMSQTPKVYKVSSQKEYIILLFALLFRDAGEGPINANDEAVGIFLGNHLRAQSCSTPCVDHNLGLDRMFLSKLLSNVECILVEVHHGSLIEKNGKCSGMLQRKRCGRIWIALSINSVQAHTLLCGEIRLLEKTLTASRAAYPSLSLGTRSLWSRCEPD